MLTSIVDFLNIVFAILISNIVISYGKKAKIPIILLGTIISVTSFIFKIELVVPYIIFLILITLLIESQKRIFASLVPFITLQIPILAISILVAEMLGFTRLIDLKLILSIIGIITVGYFNIKQKTTQFIIEDLSKFYDKYKNISTAILYFFYILFAYLLIEWVDVGIKDMTGNTDFLALLISLFTVALFFIVILLIKENKLTKEKNKRYEQHLKYSEAHKKIIDEILSFWHNYNSIMDTLNVMIDEIPEFKYKDQLIAKTSESKRTATRNNISIIKIPDQLLSAFLSTKIDILSKKYNEDESYEISIGTYNDGKFSSEIKDIMFLNQSLGILLDNAFQSTYNADKTIDMEFYFHEDGFQITIINSFNPNVKKEHSHKEVNGLGLNFIKENITKTDFNFYTNIEEDIFEARVKYEIEKKVR